ncbi:RICIN domain-containing protein [Streptomyces sp. NPDC052020]|uniref:RICIN domain-containing protein n=1 Tax=Streptomyces sp. NPDC052020 TaxID=3155677 RepID=UPI003436450F
MRRSRLPLRHAFAAAFAAALFFAAPGAHAAPRPAGAAVAQEINIISTHSGMCLEIGTLAEGEAVRQHRCAGRPGAQWYLRPSAAGNGSVNIVSAYSGKCLQVADSSPASGAAVRQGACGTQTGASFVFADLGSGSGAVIQPLTASPRKCLEVTDSSTADGAALRQWDCERQPGTGFAQGQFKGLAEGWSTIRPVGAPGLCLTEGRARSGAYGSAVAVQRPCATATPPRTYLQSAGNGLYRIQWHHPEFGVGCLTVMSGGPVPGMLEPWDDCARATQFHVEPVDSPVFGGYRFRVSGSSLCLGIVNGETVAGAEAVQAACAGRADQEFFVDPAA